MNMQMDTYFKKVADWYPFCLGGGAGRGVRGWVVGQGNPAQKLGMPVQNVYFWPLLRILIIKG